MKAQSSSGVRARRKMLRIGASTGLKYAAIALLPGAFSSGVLASGRHSSPAQCLPSPAFFAPASPTPPPISSLQSVVPQTPISVGSPAAAPARPPSSKPTTFELPTFELPSFGGFSKGSPGGSGGGAICLLKGTRITTDQGLVEIEHLQIGDRVLTHAGDYKPIKWIGRMSFKKAAGASWRHNVEPIRISQSAFEPGVPSVDLYVSPNHAMLLNGCLIPAKYLINDLSIKAAAPDELDRLDYFQLEFEKHEVIYAEGAFAESFQSDGQREMFSNFAEYERLYGADNTAMTPYAPLIRYQRAADVVAALLRIAISSLGVDVRNPVQVTYDILALQAEFLAESRS